MTSDGSSTSLHSNDSLSYLKKELSMIESAQKEEELSDMSFSKPKELEMLGSISDFESIRGSINQSLGLDNIDEYLTQANQD